MSPANAMTTKESVRLICKSVLNRLENSKAITFLPRLRSVIQDEMFNLVSPYVLTEEDMRERTLAKIGARVDQLNDSGLSDSDQYKTARAIVKASFGDDVLNGYYFQKPIKTIANDLAKYLMRSSNIEDVFEDDLEIERQIVDTIKKFDLSEQH